MQVKYHSMCGYNINTNIHTDPVPPHRATVVFLHHGAAHSFHIKEAFMKDLYGVLTALSTNCNMNI